MSDSDHAVVQKPKFNNVLANTAGPANDIVHGTGTGNSVIDDIHNMMDPLNVNHAPQGNGIESDAKDQAAKDQVNQEQDKEKLDSVAAQYHDAVSSMDVTTSNEIQAALATGDATKAAQLLEQSKAGTGIYGVRQMEQKQRQLLSVMPGRQQLSPRYNFIQSRNG